MVGAAGQRQHMTPAGYGRRVLLMENELSSGCVLIAGPYLLSLDPVFSRTQVSRHCQVAPMKGFGSRLSHKNCKRGTGLEVNQFRLLPGLAWTAARQKVASRRELP